MIMVNIRINQSSSNPIDLSKMCYQICEALRGNRGFIENDIIVADPSHDEGNLLTSLGDDADVNSRKIDLIVTLEKFEDNKDSIETIGFGSVEI